MELNTGQWIIIILCALLIAGYIRGYLYNRQQAAQISTWLMEGLKVWGKVTPGGKMPGMVTGGRLIVESAEAPFRKLEALYLLAPRENPLFWIFHRLQGRGDEVIVWITFVVKPEQDIEFARKGDRQFSSRLTAKDKPALTLVDVPPGMQMAVEEKEGARLAGKVADFVKSYRGALLRMALRSNKPHLFLRVNLRTVQARTAGEFFNDLSVLR